MSSEALAKTKEILLAMDAFHRRGEDEPDVLHGEAEVWWEKMDSTEHKEANAYSVHLYSLWTPLEKYRQAMECLSITPITDVRARMWRELATDLFRHYLTAAERLDAAPLWDKLPPQDKLGAEQLALSLEQAEQTVRVEG